MDFKERIFQARKAKGFSQEDLAELMGVSRQAVSKWETGEAMPDVDKLIALCDALELNMEYLALGKTPAPTAPATKKPLLWVGVSLLSLVFFGVGFLLGFRAAPQAPIESTAQPTVIVSRQQAATPGPVADVIVKPLGKGKLELHILPAVLTEGTEVTVVCEDKLLGKAQTYACTFDGNYYRLQLPKSDKYHYYITASLDINGKKRQLPLVEISGDKYTWSTVPLWKG